MELLRRFVRFIGRVLLILLKAAAWILGFLVIIVMIAQGMEAARKEEERERLGRAATLTPTAARRVPPLRSSSRQSPTRPVPRHSIEYEEDRSDRSRRVLRYTDEEEYRESSPSRRWPARGYNRSPPWRPPDPWRVHRSAHERCTRLEVYAGEAPVRCHDECYRSKRDRNRAHCESR